MYIQPINNTSSNFEATRVKTISIKELKVLKDLEQNYNTLTQKISGMNGVYNLPFRKCFPDLYTGKQIKGFFLTSAEAEGIKYYLYRYSKKSPLTFNVKTAEGASETITSCYLDTNNNFVIKTSESLDAKLQDEKSLFKMIATHFKLMIKEFDLLCNYSEYYFDIKSQLKEGLSKKHILDLIIGAKQKRQNSVPTNELAPQVTKLLSDYENMKKALTYDFSKHSLKFKEAYFSKEQVQSNRKSIRFYNKLGESISYTQLQSKADDRCFRLLKYDSSGDLKNVFVGFKDGTFARLKDIENVDDLRPNNLVKLSQSDLKNLTLDSDMAFLSDEFIKFENFINEYIKANFKQKKSGINDGVKEDKEAKLLKKQLKKELEEQKRLKRIEKQKIREEKLLKAAQKKQARNVSVQRRAKKVPIEKIKKRVPVVNYDDFQKMLNSAKDIKQISFIELVGRIKGIFDTPVSERAQHLSHEKLSDGRIFAGKFFVKTKDGVKISVTKIKSARYVDFEYYSLKAEKGEQKLVMNIDFFNNGIILSDEKGKPILDGAKVCYLTKQEYIDKYPMAKDLPKYLQEIFCNTSKEGKVVSSELKLKKKVSAEDVMNTKLPEDAYELLNRTEL